MLSFTYYQANSSVKQKKQQQNFRKLGVEIICDKYLKGRLAIIPKPDGYLPIETFHQISIENGTA